MAINTKYFEWDVCPTWKWRYLKYIRYTGLDIGWDRRPKEECHTGKFILVIMQYDGYNVLFKLHRFYIGAWHL